ncbi:MAG TPA: type IV pilus modification protein PilV [Tahibacter sp.]|jgi:type IV pilus assembly protein PilV|nr:type IV pilus modification protein PilV [Tahibacter sp.]
MRIRRLNRGLSLVEVLVAVMVFSVGLIGLAGLMLVSQRTNHSAYLRTQASFLAQSMADRMRGNIGGVWAELYNQTYPQTGTPPACSSGASCGMTDLAQRDRLAWSTQLTSLLPAPTATITCTRLSGMAVATELQAGGAPYDGLCTFVMTWSEASLSTTATSSQQTFAWVFQP